MNERAVKMAWIAQVWDVFNLATGSSMPVVAIGPRDALMAVAGWQSVWKEKIDGVEWLCCQGWRVENRAIINGEWK